MKNDNIWAIIAFLGTFMFLGPVGAYLASKDESTPTVLLGSFVWWIIAIFIFNVIF